MNQLFGSLWLIFLILIFAAPFAIWCFIGISAFFVKNLALAVASVIFFFSLVYFAGLRYIGV